MFGSVEEEKGYFLSISTNEIASCSELSMFLFEFWAYNQYFNRLNCTLQILPKTINVSERRASKQTHAPDI